MKLATYIISLLALAVLIFNITKINFETPLEGNSFTAIITTISAACAILIAAALRLAKKVDKLVKKKT